MPLIPKHEAFCRQYLVDFNGTQAAIRAGYSRKTAYSIASALLKRPDIQDRLNVLKAETAARFEADADDVIRMWWETATADPNELVQHRIGACRYCHGYMHQHQWKTDREFLDAQAEYDARHPLAKEGEAERLRPSEEVNHGGYGYRHNAPPNRECPECAGEGIGYVVMLDTTTLSPQARLLYNGVKETRQGREMLMADRQRAIEHVARRLGLMKEQVEVEASSSFAILLQHILTSGSAAPIATARSILIPPPDNGEGKG